MDLCPPANEARHGPDDSDVPYGLAVDTAIKGSTIEAGEHASLAFSLWSKNSDRAPRSAWWLATIGLICSDAARDLCSPAYDEILRGLGERGEKMAQDYLDTALAAIVGAVRSGYPADDIRLEVEPLLWSHVEAHLP